MGDEATAPKGVEQRTADLLGFAGYYRHYALAAYAEARPLFERALAIREKVLGAEHPDTATSLNNLARLLQAQGDLAGARPLYERALAIREGARPEHPDTARASTTSPAAAGPGRPRGAAALERAGDREGARPEHPTRRRASTTSPSCCRPRATSRGRGRSTSARWRSGRRCSAPSIPDTATSLNNLAVLLQAQGDLAGARPLYERALAIREKVLGAEHPDTATSLNNLASLLQDQGDLAGARPLYERALAICEKVLGAEHPDTATSLNNLADLLQAQGDLAGARPLY